MSTFIQNQNDGAWVMRSTVDPISMHEVGSEEYCVYDGDESGGVEIRFESEDNRQTYLGLGNDHRITLKGNSSDDYIAEG